MKEIKLTQGKVTLVDDGDYKWLNRWKWFAKKDRNTFYAVRKEKKIGGGQFTVYMHRKILNPLPGEKSDHEDTNGLNNQRENLRICTNQQNIMNSKLRINCLSIYKGVTWCKRSKKWLAQITINQKRKHLGYFISEFKAAYAYDKAASNYFGEFARLNFP